MVGHTFEYTAGVRHLRRVIQDGDLGRVLSIETARLNLGLYRSDVNVIRDLAPHDISITSYLLGDPPTEVSAHAPIARHQPQRGLSQRFGCVAMGSRCRRWASAWLRWALVISWGLRD